METEREIGERDRYGREAVELKHLGLVVWLGPRN